MERRKALFLTTSILGSALIGSELFLSGCTGKKAETQHLSASDINFLDEVGETILPETERSPGAKATNIGRFMNTIVADCYAEKEQRIFKAGIAELKRMSKSAYGTGFMALVPGQKHELLAKLDRDVRKLPITEDPHFFRMMKELTIWGYFTSEPGATKALRYNPIPGRFEGCIPYKNGDKAWF